MLMAALFMIVGAGKYFLKWPDSKMLGSADDVATTCLRHCSLKAETDNARGMGIATFQ